MFTQSYFAETGQAVYKHRRKVSRKPYKLYKVSDFIEFATKKIKEDRWLPDAVVGYVRLQALFDKNRSVCTSILYRYIDEGLLDITNMDLLLKLRRNTRKRRVRANKRVLGTKDKEEPVLLTLIERQTRYEIIFKIDGKTDHAVSDAMSRIAIVPNASQVFKTITADNGSEFSSLEECMSNISDVYFTHPYSSCKRGTNENHNGMIRRFIPKVCLISEVGEYTIRGINQWMNQLPRKVHNYQTPIEMFDQQLSALTLT